MTSGALERAAFGLSVDATAAKCVAALIAAGIDSILIKGPATAYWLQTPRTYSDVDLLVRGDAVAKAVSVLETVGHVDYVSDPAERLRLEPPHARTLVPAELPSARGAPPACAIDLHWSFHGVTEPWQRFWDVMRRDAVEHPLFGTPVLIPSRNSAALIVALHARLPKESQKAAADLERGLDVLPRETWASAAELAREVGAIDQFALGLRSSDRGTTIADDLRLPGGSNVLVTLCEQDAPGMSHALQSFSEKRGFRLRAVVLGRALVPTPDYMRNWIPLAGRGRLGLIAAYVWRPFSLLIRLPGAALALRRVRRSTPGRELTEPGEYG